MERSSRRAAARPAAPVGQPDQGGSGDSDVRESLLSSNDTLTVSPRCARISNSDSAKTGDAYRRAIEHYLADWVSRPLNAIERREVEARFTLLTRNHGWAIRLGRDAQVQSGWSALLSSDPLPDEFDDWLAERFARRVHPPALEVVSELPWSAVFTSSFDPTLKELLRSPGREPEEVLTVQETPLAVRSRARPPLYFSSAGRANTMRRRACRGAGASATRDEFDMPCRCWTGCWIPRPRSASSWLRDSRPAPTGSGWKTCWESSVTRFRTRSCGSGGDHALVATKRSSSRKRWPLTASSSNLADWAPWWLSCALWVGSMTSRRPIRKTPERSASGTGAAWRRQPSKGCELKR